MRELIRHARALRDRRIYTETILLDVTRRLAERREISVGKVLYFRTGPEP